MCNECMKDLQYNFYAAQLEQHLHSYHDYDDYNITDERGQTNEKNNQESYWYLDFDPLREGRVLAPRGDVFLCFLKSGVFFLKSRKL